MALFPKATSIGLGMADSALGSQVFLFGVGLLLLGSGDFARLLAISLASPAVGML